MRIILCFLVILFVHINLYAQKGKSFNEKFTEAKDLLYNFHPEEALGILLELEKEDPENGNILYLIGACYTDYNPESGTSITYLEKAKPFVSDNYDADAPTERNASIHLHYFLAVAYAQNQRCEEAEASN